MKQKLDAEDREYMQEYKNELAVYCAFCSGVLAWNKPVAQCTEGEYAHIRCAVKSIDYACEKCGRMTDADDFEDNEGHCAECDGKLMSISKRQARKKLGRTTLAKEEPELYDI